MTVTAIFWKDGKAVEYEGLVVDSHIHQALWDLPCADLSVKPVEFGIFMSPSELTKNSSRLISRDPFWMWQKKHQLPKAFQLWLMVNGIT